MQYKKFQSKYILRLDKGEEIVSSIKKFCKKENILLGTISGIGAVNKVKIGLFDTKEKKYYSNDYEGDFEICPLLGNISTMNKEIYLHIHINVADKNNRSFGGHLSEAYVSATFEAVIERIEGNVNRKLSDEIGLNLIEF